ncbi:MAG: class I SAM-dependent methyltransferase, partial [Candidatus Acidiferrales bacterium]
MHDREVAMAALLRASGVQSLRGLRILDVGCGRGDLLRQLLSYDAEPSCLFGLDLLNDRVQEARRFSPHFYFVCGSGSQLPFPDGSFELVVQFTVFTSVLSESFRRSMASEILRVMSPGGRLLWYDFAYDNPRNPDVRGIGRAEIRRLFPGCTMKLRRVTLAPPLGRIV